MAVAETAGESHGSRPSLVVCDYTGMYLSLRHFERTRYRDLQLDWYGHPVANGYDLSRLPRGIASTSAKKWCKLLLADVLLNQNIRYSSVIVLAPQCQGLGPMHTKG